MRIDSLSPLARVSVPYLAATARGEREPRALPILEGTATLPPELTSLVLTGDLQGVGERQGQHELLGHTVARALVDQGLVEPASTGVILTGDLYADPSATKRGASGEVGPVWSDFAARFRWAAGVLGNHDRLGVRPSDRERFNGKHTTHILDGERALLDELIVAGLSGIVGKPQRLLRRDMATFVADAARVSEGANVLVLHESPAGSEGQRGKPELRTMLEDSGPPLTVCGHCYWPEPLAELAGGRQVLNVDSRVVILKRP